MDERTDKHVYEFASFRVDVHERLLFSDEDPTTLPPKVFDTLLMLVENCGRIVLKEDLMKRVWPESFVEENNLAQNISILRKTLGDGPGSRFIETIPKYGYRFTADVSTLETNDSALHTSGAGRPPSKPVTNYVLSGDANIAYQVIGENGIDIVFVMGWVSHLEYSWEEPNFAAFLNHLASFSRLILFDKRGTGLSDRVPVSELPTLEQRMEDVHAVLDAVGSDRAVLIGVSEGGPMCTLFAATYPERTSALVMIGTYAKRVRDDDYPWGVSAQDRDSFFELMRRDWGKPVGIEERAPSLADDESFREWWATYLRLGASPGAAVALTKMNSEIDVRSVLPSIRVPTLVIHRVGDMCLKVEEGRYVASQIPGSKFVELEGTDHLPFVGDQRAVLDEIEAFLVDVRHAGSIDRVLGTVLCVNINGNAKSGSLSCADEVRRQLAIFKGREVLYDKNGLTAVFDGPARAIRCSIAIRDVAGQKGSLVQTGLHTGEIDIIDEKPSGFALELTKTIANESLPGEILVSRTVKDLVAGSGIGFVEKGVKSFEGIQGEWRLFSVDR
ncbi:MAG: alpha/beta fold hydrolase [Pyrinomonadaceae bacterium]